MIAYITFSGLIDQLPGEQFLRVHKSYTVAIGKITAIEGNEITMNKVKIPISRNLRDEVMNKILKKNLLKR